MFVCVCVFECVCVCVCVCVCMRVCVCVGGEGLVHIHVHEGWMQSVGCTSSPQNGGHCGRRGTLLPDCGGAGIVQSALQ